MKFNIYFSFFSSAFSCELSKKFLSQHYEKLAEQLASREDLKIARVDCDKHKDFCSSQGAKGLTVIYYPLESDPIRFKGVKTVEGLSAFLIKQIGDSLIENLISVPDKLDALVELTEETFNDHVASGNHLVKFYAPWCGHCQVN